MKGLTLFEVLVSLLIFTIIAVGLGYAVVAGKSALFVSDIPTQLRQSVLFGLMPMVRELRQTAPNKTNIAVGGTVNTVTFKLPHDNNGDGVEVDNTGKVEWDNTSVTYSLNGAKQLIRSYGGANKVIAANIISLQFSRPAAAPGDKETLLQINVNAQKTDARGTVYQDSEQMTIKMRNTDE